MAIPTWLADDGWGTAEAEPTPAQLDRVADTVAALSHGARLDILATLDRTEPASYSDLRADTDVDDNGQFNYHLRQLDGLVADGPDGYTLTDRGERVLELVFEEARLGDPSDS
ncbi:winged helix-turn-helix domain-containing protein [Halorientalis marina]|jgi:hypothetical protein|uniref:winged helix-turn-helix domain-containing protein n=1 Tax=Halorientalis marina TaxID=2931976 RepID=UPI001FF5F005|nr:helix-turn-helix domain-containing protein [Halorientalis marina]